MWLVLAISVFNLLLGGGMMLFLRGYLDGEVGPSAQSSEKTEAVLARMHELAQSVEQNLGEHTQSMEAASLKIDVNDPTSVVSASELIVDANRKLQAELAAAKAEIQKQQEQLHAQMAEARTDALTGLANRRAYDDEMTRRYAQYRRMGVPMYLVLVDVDHFKQFNDTYGHKAGDEVLRTVGRTLKKTARETDLPARYGGEEFVVLLPDVGLEGAQRAAERIRTVLAAATCEYNGMSLKVTASVGLAGFLPTDDRDSLYKRSDEALYAAKKGGRNCSYYHDGVKCHLINLDPPKPSTLVQQIFFAPYSGGPVPAASEFRTVEAEEFSMSGFSYTSSEWPTVDTWVVRFDNVDAAETKTATVGSVTESVIDGKTIFRIRCQFGPAPGANGGSTNAKRSGGVFDALAASLPAAPAETASNSSFDRPAPEARETSNLAPRAGEASGSASESSTAVL